MNGPCTVRDKENSITVDMVTRKIWKEPRYLSNFTFLLSSSK